MKKPLHRNVLSCAASPLQLSELKTSKQICYQVAIWSKRVNDDLLVVDDAPGLDVDMFQSSAYHIVVRYDSWPCNDLMKLRLCYMPELSCIGVIVFFGRVIWAVDDLML
jgi:hypothetical protein